MHRDLKPENIMLTPREGRRELIRQITDEQGLHTISEREKAFDFVKILDFGVAKVRDPDASEGRVTQQGVVFGTPEYMAPETARVGVSDPRTDIYALGVIFYEMLTGTVPFAGETAVDVMLKVVSEPVIPPRMRAPGIEITPEAEQLIMKALAKDPRQRQQSMEELYEELQRCYGSVRYRRSLDVRAARRRMPIPLQRVKRPGSGPFSEPIARVTPPAWSSAPKPRPRRGPILLTRRKERARRCHGAARPGRVAPARRPHGRRQPRPDGAGHDEWSDRADMDIERDPTAPAVDGDARHRRLAASDRATERRRPQRGMHCL